MKTAYKRLNQYHRFEIEKLLALEQNSKTMSKNQELKKLKRTDK